MLEHRSTGMTKCLVSRLTKCAATLWAGPYIAGSGAVRVVFVSIDVHTVFAVSLVDGEGI